MLAVINMWYKTWLFRHIIDFSFSLLTHTPPASAVCHFATSLKLLCVLLSSNFLPLKQHFLSLHLPVCSIPFLGLDSAAFRSWWPGSRVSPGTTSTYHSFKCPLRASFFVFTTGWYTLILFWIQMFLFGAWKASHIMFLTTSLIFSVSLCWFMQIIWRMIT